MEKLKFYVLVPVRFPCLSVDPSVRFE